MAITVISHGKSYSHIAKRFPCGCGRYFEADAENYFQDDPFTAPRSAYYCPDCGNLAIEVLRNTIVYKRSD